MVLRGLYSFIQARRTRSGCEYGQVLVSPLACPSNFSLSKSLEGVLAKEIGLEASQLVEGSSEVEVDAFWSLKGFDGGAAEVFQGIEKIDEGSAEGVPAIRSVEGGGRAEEVQADAESNGSRHPHADGIRPEAYETSPVGLEEGEVDDVPNSNGKRARKQRYRASRKAKKFQLHGHLPDPAALLKQIRAGKDIPVEAGLPELPFSSCSYQANVKAPLPPTAHSSQSLSSLLQQGFALIKHVPGQSQPILDAESQKVFAVVVGHPNDSTYTDAAQRVFEVMEETRKGLKFKAKGKKNDRGRFAYTNYGISHGQGSKSPHWLLCDHEEAIKKLLVNKDLIRLAKFANHSFAMWAPKVYSYYEDVLGKLASKVSDLKWRFWESVWPCVTFNFGPQVCCRPHRDSLNLAFGWCSITALGDYNYELGGHLILYDLKLVIEFPPGSLILIPSALLAHGNTPVQPGEQRMSFTQFCSAGIFRYVENGFICETDLMVSDPHRYKERLAAKPGRKDFGLGLWSTPDELLTSNAS